MVLYFHMIVIKLLRTLGLIRFFLILYEKLIVISTGRLLHFLSLFSLPLKLLRRLNALNRINRRHMRVSDLSQFELQIVLASEAFEFISLLFSLQKIIIMLFQIIPSLHLLLPFSNIFVILVN